MVILHNGARRSMIPMCKTTLREDITFIPRQHHCRREMWAINILIRCLGSTGLRYGSSYHSTENISPHTQLKYSTVCMAAMDMVGHWPFYIHWPPIVGIPSSMADHLDPETTESTHILILTITSMNNFTEFFYNWTSMSLCKVRLNKSHQLCHCFPRWLHLATCFSNGTLQKSRM